MKLGWNWDEDHADGKTSLCMEPVMSSSFISSFALFLCDMSIFLAFIPFTRKRDGGWNCGLHRYKERIQARTKGPQWHHCTFTIMVCSLKSSQRVRRMATKMCSRNVVQWLNRKCRVWWQIKRFWSKSWCFLCCGHCHLTSSQIWTSCKSYQACMVHGV